MTLRSIAKIEAWLKEYSINNYVISEDSQVTVYGNVDLNNKLKDYSVLPIKFKLVDGYFDISNNHLTSLEFCPNTVNKDFNCSNNELSSLFGCPEKVGDFNCSYNKLTNLSYAPKDVKGYFDCSNNKLKSLKGSPRTIKDFYKCSNNSIISLKGGPKYVGTYFDCSSNSIEKLQGGPVSVGQDYICSGNVLTDLESIADEIGWDVVTDVRLNHLNSSINDDNSIKYKGSEVISHIYKPIVALNNIDEINTWLLRHDIKNFTILDDNTVNVHGDVRLSRRLANLLKLPLKFNEIEGDFDISDNELISLEGSPKKVSGDFLAYKNELSSLRGGPKEVEGNFVILQNNINSLKYAPTNIKGDFICSHNPIEDLDGLTNIRGDVFTGVYIQKIKSQKFVYKGINTYKYNGEAIVEYLNKEYIVLTEEEKLYEKTRRNLEKVITDMVISKELTLDMITDVLLNNLEKYNLDDLKMKLMMLKNPPKTNKPDELSELEIKQLAFTKAI